MRVFLIPPMGSGSVTSDFFLILSAKSCILLLYFRSENVSCKSAIYYYTIIEAKYAEADLERDEQLKRLLFTF